MFLKAFFGPTICFDWICTFISLRLCLQLNYTLSFLFLFNRCPSNLCTIPTIATFTSTNSYLQLNQELQTHSITSIALRFRTRWATFNSLLLHLNPEFLMMFSYKETNFCTNLWSRSANGLLFFLGGPAYLTAFLQEGFVRIGLNTRVSCLNFLGTALSKLLIEGPQNFIVTMSRDTQLSI